MFPEGQQKQLLFTTAIVLGVLLGESCIGSIFYSYSKVKVVGI